MKLLNMYVFALMLVAHNIVYSCCDTDCADEKSCVSSCAQSVSTWLPRAVSSYSMHDIYQNMYTYQHENKHCNFTLVTDYQQNFGKCSNCKGLGSRMFWSGTNRLTIGTNDGRADLDAYQLGLGNVVTDADGIAGIIEIDPLVQIASTDFMFQWLQNKDERGLYFKLQAPLGAMSIDPRLREIKSVKVDENLFFTQTATDGSTFEYAFIAYPTPDRRAQTVTQALSGAGTADNVFKGNLSNPIRLRKSRISTCKLTTIRIADITTALGYNVYASEKGFVGLGFKASLPTGNIPTADYAYEPIFGRAGAWGLGGEVSVRYCLWDQHKSSSVYHSSYSKHSNRILNMYVQGEVLHLLPGRRPNFRTFDLKQNGVGSKFLLVQNYLTVYVQNPLNTSTAELESMSNPFALQPAANITTLPVISKIAVEGSLAVLFDFKFDSWNVAIGGEFWGRSHEKLCIDQCFARDLRIPDLNEYAVLGRQVSSYNIQGQTLQSSTPPNPVSVYLCEPAATINASLPALQLVGPAPYSVPTTYPEGIVDARDAKNRIPSDITEALDIAGAQAGRAFTGKVTGLVGYTWHDRHYMPSIALTGGAEFTNNTNNAVQLWSIGLVGSLNF